MDNNSSYFYISGFISISLFIFFCLLFAFTLFDTHRMNVFAMNKDTFVSISLESVPIKSKVSKKSVSQPVVENKAPVKESENIDVNDLFSDVWTKNIVHKKEKPVNSKRLQEIQKSIKKVDLEKSSKSSNSDSNAKNYDNKNEKNNASVANEVNEYLAKIQAIVYAHFNVPPNSQGSVVVTVIELNSLGQLVDFRVLTYSQNSALNEEADRMKERLKSVVFPVNPENKSSSTIVKLIAKE